MRIIQAAAIAQAVRDACIEACCALPADVLAALTQAEAAEEGPGKAVLSQLLENAALARAACRPCCQDTGMAVVFVDLGQDVQIVGSLEAAVVSSVDKACALAELLRLLPRLLPAQISPVYVLAKPLRARVC